MLSKSSINGKKILWILFFLIIFIGAITALFSNNFFKNNKPLDNKELETAEFIQEIRSFVKETTDNKTPNERIENELAKLKNDSLSDQKKFEALSNLAFYFADEYATKHNPSVREFSSTVIAKYAKENYPNLYNESMFNFVCADLSCGQELSLEIKQIFKLLDESGAEPEYIDAIKSNLTVIGYIPDSEVDEKKYGFSFIYPQILELNNPKASEAAKILKNYAKQKYNTDL